MKHAVSPFSTYQPHVSDHVSEGLKEYPCKLAIDIAWRFLRGAWTELPSDLSFWRKMFLFHFCGLRFLNESHWRQIEAMDTVEEEPKVNRQQNSHASDMLLLALCGYALFDYLSGNLGTCETMDLDHMAENDGAMVRAVIGMGRAWILAQVFVRVAADRPQRAYHHHKIGWGSLLIIENFIWLLLLLSQEVMRVAALFFCEGCRRRVLVVNLISHIYRAMNTFLIISPCLCFNLVPRDNKLSESCFIVIVGWFLLYSAETVFEDTICSHKVLESLMGKMNEFWSICFTLCSHFLYTHRLCIALMVFTRSHVQEQMHALPNIALIMEMFTPLRQRCPFLCKVILFAALAVALPSSIHIVEAHLDAPAELRFIPRAVYLISLDGPFLVWILWVYYHGEQVRCHASWESILVVVTGTGGLASHLVFLTSDAQSVSRLQRAVLWLDALTTFASTLLAADIFSKRLRLPARWATTRYPLLFSLISLVDWVIVEGTHHHDHLNPDPDGDHRRLRLSNSTLAAPGEHIGSTRTYMKLFLEVGQFALAEAALIQTSGWLVHCLEGVEEEYGHDDTNEWESFHGSHYNVNVGPGNVNVGTGNVNVATLGLSPRHMQRPGPLYSGSRLPVDFTRTTVSNTSSRSGLGAGAARGDLALWRQARQSAFSLQKNTNKARRSRQDTQISSLRSQSQPRPMSPGFGNGQGAEMTNVVMLES